MPEATEVQGPASNSQPTGAGAGERHVVACPYLLSADGAWRASSPNGAHRCTAVAPPAPLGEDKQRRLCLVAAHETCATYMAAREARHARGLDRDDESGRSWFARTTPVVDVRSGLGGTISGILADRRSRQAIPVAALVLVLVVVGWSGLGRSPTGGGPASSFIAVASSSIVTRTPTPSAAPTPSSAPAPTASPTPTPTAPPTPGPTATSAPSARTTYTVKTGDTLYGIAQAFGTSVSAIKSLNGLTSNVIHSGLVLLIP